MRSVGLPVLSLLAAAFVAGGCWPFGGAPAKPPAAGTAPAPRRPETPAAPAPADAAAEAAVPGRLPEAALRPLGAPRGKEPKTAEEVVAALKSGRPGERILGLTAAMRLHPPEARAQLERIVRRDSTFAPAAVEILAGYPDPAAERALLAALDSPHRDARSTAARELSARGVLPGSEVEKALARLLRKDRDWQVRSAAARALSLGGGGRYGLVSGRALEEALADAAENEQVRLEAAAALARTTGNASGWDYLSAACVDRSGQRGIRALGLAAEVGTDRGAAMLAVALNGDRTEVWTAAARLFELVGRDAALGALAGQLRAGGEPGRRAALALAPFEGHRLVPELVKAMEDGSQVVRAAACAALARAAGTGAAPALERKLQDARELPQVRLAAATALGAVGGPGAAVTLRTVAGGDADQLIRTAAKNALDLLQARLEKKGPETADPGELERLALARWSLIGVEPGGAARFRDGQGEVRVCSPGDELALGYALARVLGPGEEPTAPEALLAGPEAADRDMLRAILAKGGRAVVLAAPGIRAGGR
ncbi:MAG TPA: HEAT repeat domain-containing protein [Planctomycetota bacterium]|nr:HEAT repeat domain-containing protein [Planctomycetota bacterium]